MMLINIVLVYLVLHALFPFQKEANFLNNKSNARKTKWGLAKNTIKHLIPWLGYFRSFCVHMHVHTNTHMCTVFPTHILSYQEFISPEK